MPNRAQGGPDDREHARRFVRRRQVSQRCVACSACSDCHFDLRHLGVGLLPPARRNDHAADCSAERRHRHLRVPRLGARVHVLRARVHVELDLVRGGFHRAAVAQVVARARTHARACCVRQPRCVRTAHRRAWCVDWRRHVERARVLPEPLGHGAVDLLVAVARDGLLLDELLRAARAREDAARTARCRRWDRNGRRANGARRVQATRAHAAARGGGGCDGRRRRDGRRCLLRASGTEVGHG